MDTKGTVAATGKDSSAIFLQSGVQRSDGSMDPRRTGGNITVHHDGVLRGGSGTGAAIRIDGGHDNLIDISAGSMVSAASGTAIVTSFGNDTVRNAERSSETSISAPGATLSRTSQAAPTSAAPA